MHENGLRKLVQSIFVHLLLLSHSDIETLRFQLYFIRLKTAAGNITCRKTNITAKQYNSPKGE